MSIFGKIMSAIWEQARPRAPGPQPAQAPAQQRADMGSTLARGQACTVSVRFSPTTRGLKTATLVISSNDPDENPVAVQLSGTGTRR